jgi:hypothetical protein
MLRAAFAVLLATLLASAAQAIKYDATKVVTAQTKAEFADQAQRVREGMQRGGRYEFVTASERGRVEKRLAEIEALFAAYVEGTPLRDAKLTDLLTAQEEINGILTRRDGERLVCSQTMPTGSHRAVSNCKRYADIERSHLDSERLIRDIGEIKHDASWDCPSGKCTH